MAHAYGTENARSADELRALVGSLTDAQLATSLGGGWTVGTALAHLAFWDGRVAAVCALWSAGRPTHTSWAEDAADDAINASLDALLTLVPAREAARVAIEAAEAANAALAGLTPELAARATAPDSLIAGLRANHRREHMTQIRAAIGG